MGLGFVLSFGYWCTDFLVIERAVAAESHDSAAEGADHRGGAEDVFPFLVILPGPFSAIKINTNALPLLFVRASENPVS